MTPPDLDYPAHPALVLAAGASRRMGRCKLTLPFPPDPLQLPPPPAPTVLGRVLWTAHSAGCRPLWVTYRPPLSPELAAVFAACPFARPVPAPLAGQGQAESLKAGIRAALEEMPELADEASSAVSGLMLLLGDQPLLPVAFLAECWAWHEEEPERASAPVCGGQRGHPVILPLAALPAGLALCGDTGARPLLANYRLRLRPTDVTATVTDLDTQAAYQAACQAARLATVWPHSTPTSRCRHEH